MKFLETNTTGELGVIEVNKIVRLNNSIFHVIQRENDIGIDALIEFITDEKPTNKMVGVQTTSSFENFSVFFRAYCLVSSVIVPFSQRLPCQGI